MLRPSTRKLLVKVSIVYAVIFAIVGGMIAYLVLKKQEHRRYVRMLEEMEWPYHDMMKGSAYSNKYDGVDISHHQGRIHWNDMEKNEPLQFIYVRVFGKNGREDKVYNLNILRAHQHKIPVGTYMFFTMSHSAVAQYQHFRQKVRKEKQDLIPVIDVEDQSLNADFTHLKDSVMVIAKFIERDYGVKPMIYSSQMHYRQYLAPTFDSYPLWIANYNREPHLNGVKPLLWQYSEKGHIHGVWTYIDLDRFINGGSLAKLRMPRTKSKSSSTP